MYWKPKARYEMRCQECGQETFLPFQCPYCGGQFCTGHRLPENHACPKIELARASKQEPVPVLKSPSSYKYSVTLGQPRVTKGRVYFSPKEVKHLTVAGLLVMGIGLSSLLYSSLLDKDWVFGLSVFGIFAVILTASFLSHEIAHKVTAQRRGLWAEFRLTTWGSILTLISVISPLFKIISPGAVMISGNASGKEMVRISLAGPTTNMVLSVILLGAALLSGLYVPLFYSILMLAAFLNGFMAVFNLIPVGILDGFKIFSWDKKVWGLAFSASAALTIIAYVFAQGLIG